MITISLLTKKPKVVMISTSGELDGTRFSSFFIFFLNGNNKTKEIIRVHKRMKAIRVHTK